MLVIRRISGINWTDLKAEINFLLIYKLMFVGLIPPLILLCLYDYLSLKMDVMDHIHFKMKSIFRWCVYVSFILILIFISVKDTAGVFIYFQF